MIRVFLVDDHEIVRRGLAGLLAASGGITVVGEAGDVKSALEIFPTLDVDVAVLDVQLPDGNGVELCRELRDLAPELRCLMLTSFSDDEAFDAAIAAGWSSGELAVRFTEAYATLVGRGRYSQVACKFVRVVRAALVHPLR